MRIQLWRPPRAHGEQPSERVVGPLELFYDLVIVVLIGRAAQYLSTDLTWSGLGTFAVAFALIWIAWFNGSLHHELHGTDDDARSRSVFLLQILILVPLGAYIPRADGAHGAAFAITASVLFLVLAVLWWRAGRNDSESYCLAHHLYEVDGQRTLMVASLRYLDQFAKQADGSWLFAERRLMVDWTETRPSNP